MSSTERFNLLRAPQPTLGDVTTPPPNGDRCVSQNLGIVLSEEELGALIRKYSKRGDVDYRAFADEISAVFTEKNLERSPQKVCRPCAFVFGLRYFS
jgi:hypothetical protein